MNESPTAYKKTLQDELMIFMEAYGSIKVSVYSDMLVYKVTPGWAAKAAARANDLIKLRGLNLVAIPTDLHSKDSFMVKSKND